MSQQSFAITLLLVVVIGFGGIIAYDVASKNGLHINQQKSNWEWSDDWNNVQPHAIPQQPQQQPQRPQQPQQPQRPQRPNGQVVATSFPDAVAKSKQYNMPILAFFEADWCSWCQKMKKEVLSDSKVKDAMLMYVFVRVDTDNNRETAQKFNIRSLPSYVITDSSQRTIRQEKGYKSASEFETWLRTEIERQPEQQPQPQPEPRRQQPQRRG